MPRTLPEKAVGHVDSMTVDELLGKHVCGLTGFVFDNEVDYLNHTSPVTGKTPKDQEHLGANFIRQSKKALERTGSLDETRKTEMDDKIKAVKEGGIQSKLDESKARPDFKPKEFQKNAR